MHNVCGSWALSSTTSAGPRSSEARRGATSLGVIRTYRLVAGLMKHHVHRLLRCTLGQHYAGSKMRWPWTGDEDKRKQSLGPWSDLLDPANWSWSTFTDPGTLVPSLVFTATTLSALRIYKSYLRRIPSVNHIKPHYFRRRTIFGHVTSVGDADNFRLFHTPGGRLSGWGWVPWKKVPATREGLQKKTVSIFSISQR